MEKLLDAIDGRPTEPFTLIEPQLILRSSTINRN
jgi:LacI family transcriptional regulator